MTEQLNLLQNVVLMEEEIWKKRATWHIYCKLKDGGVRCFPSFVEGNIQDVCRQLPIGANFVIAIIKQEGEIPRVPSLDEQKAIIAAYYPRD